MDAATMETLVDLVIDLERAGVQELIPDGDVLQYRPQSALTPDLAERIRAHKADLLAVLRPAEAPRDSNLVSGGFDLAKAPENQPEATPAPIRWEDCIDPPDPCPECGGLLSWWNALGDRRCLTCDQPVQAMRALERAERIRRRCGKLAKVSTFMSTGG